MVPCMSCHVDTYRASVYFIPQTKLVTLPIVFLLATSQIPSEDAVPLYILFQHASDTCNGPGMQAGIILTLLLGGSAEQAISCLMVWWKENKTRVIKNNWNISSCCSTTVSSMFIALIGSDQIKRRGALSLFGLLPLVHSSQGSRYHRGSGYIWEAPCKIHGVLLWTVKRVTSIRVPYMEGLARRDSRLSLFLIWDQKQPRATGSWQNSFLSSSPGNKVWTPCKID